MKTFQQNWNDGNHTFLLNQIGENFELKINNQTFSY
jgi:hypothetical protein